MKLIVGKYCNKCKAVETAIRNKANVKIVDVESVDAIVDIAYYITELHPQLPILITNDETIICGDVKRIIDVVNKG